MRKLALATAAAAIVIATPALAGGERGPAHSAYSPGGGPYGQLLRGIWRTAFWGPPPGFSSPGRHAGWSTGKHWGWFKKPKHPHWPHHPVSP